MIRHILMKDLRRLWPFVAGLALLHLALAVMHVKLGLFPDDEPALHQLVQNLELLAALLIFFTAIMVVQLDPIPDDRQDWLVRPIRRRDLLLAKLGFMILLVLGPLFAAGLVQGLASGFPLPQALAASASWSLYEFVNPVLPALAVAAVSRSIGQSLGLGFALIGGAAILVGGLVWAEKTLSNASSWNIIGTLSAWMIWNALIVAGAGMVLGLQYFRRETLRGRIALGGIALLLAAAQLMLPADTALAMQAWLLPAPDIRLAFVPEARKPVTDTSAPRHSEPPVRIALPLKFSGTPADLTLLGESVRATFIAPDGTSVEAQDEVIRLQDGVPFQQLLSVPRQFFLDHAGEKVRVELEYLLGVMRPLETHQIAARDGDLWLPEGAHCVSRVNRAGTGVQLGCLQVGNVHARLRAALVEGAGTYPNGWQIRHFPSDAPYSNGAEMIAAFNMNLKLKNPDANLPAVTVTMSQPVAHLLRWITIPGILLKNWKVESTGHEENDHVPDR